MGTISVEYPESLTATLNQSREAIEQEARMAMAAKLFELGRLTGISRVRFLLECACFGVPSVYWKKDENY